MAKRIEFDQRPGPVSAPRTQTGRSALGEELTEFGGKMQRLSAQLGEEWVKGREQEESEKGARDAAAGTFAKAPGTTRADAAYNAAGLQTYFEDLKIRTGDEVERIYNQNKHDPAALDTAIQAYSDGTEAELVKSMPELLPHFKAFYDRTSRPYRAKAADDHFQAAQDQARASFTETLAGKARQAENRAFVGGDSPSADADNTIARNDYLEGLTTAGPKTAFTLRGKTYDADPRRSGLMDVAALEKGVQAYDQAVVEARYKGAGQKAINGGRGEPYVLRLMNSKQAADDMGLDGRDSVVSWLRTQMSIRAGFDDASDKSLGQALQAYESAVVAGAQPGGGDSLYRATRGTKYEAAFDALQKNQDELATFGRMRPGDQVATQAAQQAKIAAISADDPKAYAVAQGAAVQLLRWMEQSHAETLTGLKKDPYAFAQKMGVVPAAPPLLQPDGTLNAGGWAARIEGATMGGNYYGAPMPPITREEGAQLVQGLLTGGIERVTKTVGAVEGPSKDAFREAIRMIEPDHPAVAQVATFAMNARTSPADGVNVAALLNRGYTLTASTEGKPPLFKMKAGAEGRTAFDEAFTTYVGDTFAGDAAARQRAADGLYAAYAAYAENAPDGLSGAFDDKTFARAAAAYFGGQKVKINNGFAFPPYGMGADEFELGLKADAGSKLVGGGVYTPDQIGAVLRNAKPQNMGDGYALIVGDSYIPGPDGFPMIFTPRKVDMSEIRARRAMRYQEMDAR